MRSDRKIAIIGSGEMAVILVENADRMGIESHTFSNDPHDRAVGISDEHHDVSIFDTDSIVSTCRDLGVRGVLPTTELTISVAAVVSEALGLPGMPMGLSAKVTDKGFVRGRAEGVRGLRQPRYRIWNVDEALPEIVFYPVIVKPASMGGKRGVSFAKDGQELGKAIEYATSCMPPSKKRVMIEEFVAGGAEYSVESLSYQGEHMVIQVTEKITSGPPHCVELGHLQPARLTEEMRSKIERVVPDLLRKVGVDNTTTHTELKVVDGEVYLIELNARSGGDHIAYPLTELSTGYPYVQGAIEVATGSFDFPSRDDLEDNHCGVIFVAEQTRDFEPLFRECERFPWLYRKNVGSDGLIEIVNNQAFDTNYFMFRAGGSFPDEVMQVLNRRGARES